MFRHAPSAFFLLALLFSNPNGVPAPVSMPESGERFIVGFLSDESLLPFNQPDLDAFMLWLKGLLTSLEKEFARKNPRPLVFIPICLKKNGEPEVEVYGNPPLLSFEVKRIREMVLESASPEMKYSDFTFFLANSKKDFDTENFLEMFPGFELPQKRILREFREAGMPRRIEIIRGWVRGEALPLLADLAASVPPRFEGVVDIGRYLQVLELSGAVDVHAGTTRRHSFWRALVEMARGDPLIPAFQVLLFLHEGKLAYARRILELTLPFSASGNVSTLILSRAAAYLDIMKEDMESRMRPGIQAHDAGRFDEAERIYRDVLEKFPGEPWPFYEIYQTRLARFAGSEARPDWNETARAIYEMDPLYPFQGFAGDKKQAFQIRRRLELRELSSDLSTPENIFRYADAAVDLEAYHPAALILWSLFIFFKPEHYGNEDALGLFLYCLEKLEVPGMTALFNPQTFRNFEKIEAERRERMSSDSLYRAMKKDGEKGDVTMIVDTSRNVVKVVEESERVYPQS